MKKEEKHSQIDNKTIWTFVVMGGLLAALTASQTGCETVDVGVGLYAPAPAPVVVVPAYTPPPPPPPRQVIVVPAHRPPPPSSYYYYGY